MLGLLLRESEQTPLFRTVRAMQPNLKSLARQRALVISARPSVSHMWGACTDHLNSKQWFQPSRDQERPHIRTHAPTHPPAYACTHARTHACMHACGTQSSRRIRQPQRVPRPLSSGAFHTTMPFSRHRAEE